MGVDQKHPQFSAYLDKWVKLRDISEGEDQIKEKGQLYLKPTSGMVADGMDTALAPGYVAYEAYKSRAVMPDILDDAIQAMLGVMHHKDAVIELPDKMEPLREMATAKNESLQMLLRRINEQQLLTGRCGLLADMVAAPTPKPKSTVRATGTTPRDGDLPYIALYEAEDIINWDQGTRDGITIQNLNLVTLDESGYERDATTSGSFNWTEVAKYRVLVLGEIDENEPEGVGTYKVGVFRGDESGGLDYTEANMIEPSHRGTKLDEIPFTFINSCDVVPDPDKPPLLGLGNAIMTIYRGEADYRQSLFMQGQDTLVISGGNLQDDAVRLGAGAKIDLPEGGKAEFIGPSSDGIPEQRTALENDYNRAMSKGGQLLDSVSRERESGDALKVRVAARTATLNQIALTGAFGLQQALRQIAKWIGADPEQVSVTPNLDFVDNTFTPDDLVKMITAKNSGAPLAYETIHLWLQDQDVTDLDFEEELAKIEEEDELAIGSLNPTNLAGDVTDDDEDDDPEAGGAAEDAGSEDEDEDDASGGDE